MGLLESKPLWVDTNPTGKHSCDDCPYKTDSEAFLKEHEKRYHPDQASYILYMGCSGSLEGREELTSQVSANWIDMTGGQAAFEDGDLKTFGDELVAAARDTGYKLYHVYRMHDPGLGLDFPQWWVNTGLALGIFQQYDLPEDVKAGEDNEGDEDPEKDKDEKEVHNQKDPDVKIHNQKDQDEKEVPKSYIEDQTDWNDFYVDSQDDF